MSVVAAAVVPHTPLLLPTIAKQHAGLFTQTRSAITSLADDWYAAKPDAVILISPHGLPPGTDLALHSAEKFVGRFEEYGDMVTVVSAIGAIGLSHQLKSAAEAEHVQLPLQTYDQLDYGTSVPLSFLLAAQPHLPVCSVLVGTQEPEALLRLAAVLREFTTSDRRRYLIIATADMTRRKERAPDIHRRPSAEERAFSASIVALDPSQLTAVKPNPATCGYGPLLVIVSLLSGLAKHGQVVSFEAPLGVGLLTASFSLSS